MSPRETRSTAPGRSDAGDNRRRRDALEINDSIVQGLTVIKYALELGDVELAERKTEETLAAARRLITDLLTQHVEMSQPHRLTPGSMVRSRAASTASREGES